MSKLIDTRIQKAKDELMTMTDAVVSNSAQASRSVQIFEFIGATKAMNKLATSLTSQVLFALKKIQEEEAYKEYGCKTWVEFLAAYPELDMSKSQYYKLIGLLSSEGAEVFDLLNSLNVPLNSRKQLTAGDLQIDGNELIVRDQRVPIDDAKKIKRALTQVIEQMERVESQSAKNVKEIDKLKKKLDQAKEDARVAGMGIPSDDTDPANQAYLRVIASLTELTRELSDLSSEDAEQRLSQYRPAISQAVEMCFTFSAAQSPTRRPKNNQPDALGFSQADLEDLMED